MKDINLPIVVKKDNNATIMAYCPVFKGCHTFAENENDLKNHIEDVVSMYFEMYKDGEKDIFAGENILFLNFNKNGKITNTF